MNFTTTSHHIVYVYIQIVLTQIGWLNWTELIWKKSVRSRKQQTVGLEGCKQNNKRKIVMEHESQAGFKPPDEVPRIFFSNSNRFGFD